MNLDPYIQVEEVKDLRDRVQFHFIRFNLDRTILDRILLAKATGKHLYMSRHLLAQMRYYSLVDGESRVQSGLTFCTYYSELASRLSETTVMRSVISLDGDVIYQVRRDCLEDAQRCKAIAIAHHWLIEQLLNRLTIKIEVNLLLNWLPWGLSFLIVAISIIVYAVNFNPFNPLMLLAAVVMCWLLQVGLRRLLRLLLPSIKTWAFHQLWFSLLSSNSLEKRIAKRILSQLVPRA